MSETPISIIGIVYIAFAILSTIIFYTAFKQYFVYFDQLQIIALLTYFVRSKHQIFDSILYALGCFCPIIMQNTQFLYHIDPSLTLFLYIATTFLLACLLLKFIGIKKYNTNASWKFIHLYNVFKGPIRLVYPGLIFFLMFAYVITLMKEVGVLTIWIIQYLISLLSLDLFIHGYNTN